MTRLWLYFYNSSFEFFSTPPFLIAMRTSVKVIAEHK